MSNQVRVKTVNQTLETWLIKARKATKDTNPQAPELLAGRILKLSKTDIRLHSKEVKLNIKSLHKLDNLLGRLLAGRTLSTVLKTTQFHNINLKINPRVLSPRAETEQLVEYAIKNVQESATVLDIGTGSGAIGLSIAKARPDLKVVLTDINRDALNLAKCNASLNHLKNIEFISSNLIKKVDQSIYINNQNGTYFIANLPYVDKSWTDINRKRLSFEPRSALFSGNKGLQLIKNLIDQILNINALAPDNWLLIEHDPKQFKELSLYCHKNKLDVAKISEFISLLKMKQSITN